MYNLVSPPPPKTTTKKKPRRKGEGGGEKGFFVIILHTFIIAIAIHLHLAMYVFELKVFFRLAYNKFFIFYIFLSLTSRFIILLVCTQYT
jgi:hypothetical protein